MHDLGKIEAAVDSAKSIVARLAPKFPMAKDRAELRVVEDTNVWFS
jgi:hypothetical protein